MNNRYAKILNKKNPIITGVVHHYWYNNADEKNQYYFIEWIELFFHEDEKIIFKRNEESGLIEIVDDNIQELSNQIFENFKGKISIKSIDCSETEWWKGIVNIPGISFIEDPVIEEIDYPECILIKATKAAMLICPAEEEGIYLERFNEE